MVHACWWYYFSKFTEFFDTVSVVQNVYRSNFFTVRWLVLMVMWSLLGTLACLQNICETGVCVWGGSSIRRKGYWLQSMLQKGKYLNFTLCYMFGPCHLPSSCIASQHFHEGYCLLFTVNVSELEWDHIVL